MSPTVELLPVKRFLIKVNTGSVVFDVKPRVFMTTPKI